ncbi:hypothetical protein QBC43DRAFT_132107 [Cladorrhinum sp. PSN259]|nr:hypothetical protein QBC43DRAFT_132107 [Cladorrhinum sp. PSN259]
MYVPRTQPQQFPTNNFLYFVQLQLSGAQGDGETLFGLQGGHLNYPDWHILFFKSECRIQVCSHFSLMFLFWVSSPFGHLSSCQLLKSTPTNQAFLVFVIFTVILPCFSLLLNSPQQSAAPALKSRATYSAVPIRGGGSGPGGSWAPRPVTPV